MKFRIFKFKKVKSTNNTAIRIIKNSNTDYGMIITDKQESGRGQYGKKWISYNGNLFISFFYKFDHLDISLKQITKINCLLVKNLLSIYYKKKITFKKPIKIKNSPTKPLVPGKPKAAKVNSMNKIEYFGIILTIPP